MANLSFVAVKAVALAAATALARDVERRILLAYHNAKAIPLGGSANTPPSEAPSACHAQCAPISDRLSTSAQ